MKKNRFQFIFDIGLTSIFCLLFTPQLTSLAFHEIAGLILGATLFVHILLNKDWIIAMTKKITSKGLKRKNKLSYVLNIVLFFDMFCIIISGLLISEVLFPNLRYFQKVSWVPLHIVSSIFGLIIVGIHLGLHWNWIRQLSKQFPKLVRVFSFRRPSRLVVARFLLIIGTLSVLIQVPKMVFLTPMIFEEPTFGHEKKIDNDHDITNAEKIGSRDEQNNDGLEREFDRHKPGFSVFNLIGLIPILLLYLTSLGSIAFYTYVLEKKSLSS